MSKSFHMALSVDVDRFDDRYMRKHYDGILSRDDGSRVSWRDLRVLCAEYRSNGFEAFPPCNQTDAKGNCLGHEEPGE